MRKKFQSVLAFVLLMVPFASAYADKYAETIQIFKDAGQSGTFFDSAYGYAVFPTIAKGGLVVGAASGKGQVYVGGKHVGNARLLGDGLEVGLVRHQRITTGHFA